MKGCQLILGNWAKGENTEMGYGELPFPSAPSPFLPGFSGPCKMYLTDLRDAFLFENERNKIKGSGRIILQAESKQKAEKDILQSLGFSF